MSRSYDHGDFASKAIGIASHVMWSLFYAGQAAVITWVCSSASREARKTMGLVQGLLLHPGLDKVALQQLKEFLLQTYRKKIVFSAVGFTTLDLPLLFSMCVSAMSCVLLLIQFDPMK
ncbi:hypothetical protein PR048_023150 [Dryococelus australis]|uniref:Uncharacterized protein n=1 Tax=Dryococelus australis TaxID=614101 RepID=A0ABQ9GT94_9NEOP|nr:hypothetical protein PR048_023150 [Dryococelus australis]